jgi:predicted phosphodiesterase
LAAVLSDARAAQVDGFWFLGDFCAVGFDPRGVLDQVRSLPNCACIAGNMDRQLAEGSYLPDAASVSGDPQRVALALDLARGFGWTLGATGCDGLEWLTRLPKELRFVLPDGTRVLLAHAAPGRVDGPGVRRDSTSDELRAMLHACDADLVLVGHTHIPAEHTVGGVRVVNVGGVSNPHLPDPRAWYALLDANDDGYEISVRPVEHDLGALERAVRASTHPTPDFLLSFYRGEHVEVPRSPSGPSIHPATGRHG